VRLRAPTLSKRTEAVIGYTLLVLTAPAWLGLLAMIGVAWLKRKAVGPTDEWRPWFAWFPVRADPWDWESDGWRWFEIVERRSTHMMGSTHYRTTPNESTPHHG